MKKQFDKKRQNPQGLKVGDNVVEEQEYTIELTLKEAGPKKTWAF